MHQNLLKINENLPLYFNRFTGVSGFNFYAVTIFRDSFGSGGPGGFNPHLAAVVTGSVQLVASAGSGVLCDAIGRLPLLVVSSVLMTAALAGFGSFHYFAADTASMSSTAGKCLTLRRKTN